MKIIFSYMEMINTRTKAIVTYFYLQVLPLPQASRLW
ncbi:MAG: hypothetical protein JWR38_2383 [Mucilaginibacter sp.]|nr:hypothetical protein [Mucilaginibacter sp.]